LSQTGSVRIPLTQENDPGRVIQRHLGREFAKGKQISQVIREALSNRDQPFGHVAGGRTFTAPPRMVDEIEYDPDEFGNFTEQEILDALSKEGQRP
jgi:hypothetical protein